MKKFWQRIKNFKWVPTIAYALILTALLFLFFTNDYGLVDIHKTSVVSSVGIDMEEDNMKVTALLAVPMPSENGESVLHTPVVGKGKTFADALNEINSQTGFYPKLTFCRLVVLGQSCKESNIFDLLDWFYRDDYTTLTALVAMSEGDAGEVLSSESSFSDSTSLAVERILSEELKKSANVSTVNLKVLGEQHYSPSAACYMPYIAKITPDMQEGQGGNSSDESGQSGGGGQQDSSTTPKAQGNGFYCRKTAAFVGGKFVGVLSEEQSLALNLVKNDVKRAIVAVSGEDESVTLGLKNNSGKAVLGIENGGLQLKISYLANARIQDGNSASSPKEQAEGDLVSDVWLRAAEQTITGYFEQLLSFCHENDCDLLGAKTMLYRKGNNYYAAYEKNFFSHLNTSYEVEIRSAR
jgi:Ger(x)C family germination protein